MAQDQNPVEDLFASWGQVEEQQRFSSDPVPAGTYPCRVIVDTDRATKITHAGENAKNPGAPMLQIVFEIEEGDYRGKRIFSRWMLSGKPFAVGLAKKTLRTLGVTDEVAAWTRAQGGPGALIPLLAGRKAMVTVTLKTPTDRQGNPMRREDTGEVMPARNEVEAVSEVEQEPIALETPSFSW